MARLPGFIGGAYTLQSVAIDCQKSVNLLPQITESHNQADGEIGALISVPGKRLLATVGTGPIRGVYTATTGRVVVVSGSEVYRLNSDFSYTLVGTMLTSSGRVSITDNHTQICIVDGPNGYILNMATGVFEQITSAGFPGGDTVVFHGSYFVVNIPNTNQFAYSSPWDGLAWDASEFIVKEDIPDNVISLVTCKNQLAVFGSQSWETYYISGAGTLYSRIDGSVVQYGAASAFSPVVFTDCIVWLGQGATGRGIVWQSVGYQAKRVSNHGVENALQGLDLSTATAWAYQEDGHAFYCLNVEGSDTTWVFDISTGQWHERCALASDGSLTRDRAECYTFAYDTHIVGDFENGNLYALDTAVFSDNGNPLVRLRRAPHLSADGRRIFFHKFQLMCRVGSGLDGAVTYATDPQVELRYSDDFGHTWSTAQKRSLGELGEYAKRVIWRRLGQARNRVFEVRITDPVEVAIMGAEIDAAPGVS